MFLPFDLSHLLWRKVHLCKSIFLCKSDYYLFSCVRLIVVAELVQCCQYTSTFYTDSITTRKLKVTKESASIIFSFHCCIISRLLERKKIMSGVATEHVVWIFWQRNTFPDRFVYFLRDTHSIVSLPNVLHKNVDITRRVATQRWSYPTLISSKIRFEMSISWSGRFSVGSSWQWRLA
jgi:hypothetical protein